MCTLHQVILDLPAQVDYMGVTYNIHKNKRNAFIVWCENMNYGTAWKIQAPKVLHSSTKFSPGQILHEEVDWIKMVQNGVHSDLSKYDDGLASSIKDEKFVGPLLDFAASNESFLPWSCTQ
jgi:hypothetical protein